MVRLPPGSNLLHVGPQKTGSTALQIALHEARAVLREHGVVYPGRTVRPVRAFSAGLGLARRRGIPSPDQRDWRRLLDEVAAAAELRVVISHEALGRAGPAIVRHVVEEIGGSRPHVLAVARRYDALLPSQWQQRVKAQDTRSYEEWLRVVLAEQSSDPAWRNVWVPHHTVGLVDRWSAVVGAENLTLLVADESDRTGLPRLVEDLLGLPSGLIDPPRDVGSNRSLSYHEAELLRMLMIELDALGVDDATWVRLARFGVTAALGKSPRLDDAVRIPSLPGWALDRVVELSEQRIEGLRRAGVRIVGELDDLRVAPGPDAPVSVEVPDLLSRAAVSRVVRALVAIATEPPE